MAPRDPGRPGEAGGPRWASGGARSRAGPPARTGLRGERDGAGRGEWRDGDRGRARSGRGRARRQIGEGGQERPPNSLHEIVEQCVACASGRRRARPPARAPMRYTAVRDGLKTVGPAEGRKRRRGCAADSQGRRPVATISAYPRERVGKAFSRRSRKSVPRWARRIPPAGSPAAQLVRRRLARPLVGHTGRSALRSSGALPGAGAGEEGLGRDLRRASARGPARTASRIAGAPEH